MSSRWARPEASTRGPGPGRRRTGRSPAPGSYRHRGDLGRPCPPSEAGPVHHARRAWHRRLRLRGPRAGPAAGPRHRFLRRALRSPGPQPRLPVSAAGASTSGAMAGRTGRPTADFAWSGFATDVLAVVDQLGLDRPSGFGHSCGGAAVLLAEEADPACSVPLLLRAGGHARRAPGPGWPAGTRWPTGPATRRPSPRRRWPWPLRLEAALRRLDPEALELLRGAGLEVIPATRVATVGPSGCAAGGRTRPTPSPRPCPTRPSPTSARSPARSRCAAGRTPTPSVPPHPRRAGPIAPSRVESYPGMGASARSSTPRRGRLGDPGPPLERRAAARRAPRRHTPVVVCPRALRTPHGPCPPPR